MGGHRLYLLNYPPLVNQIGERSKLLKFGHVFDIGWEQNKRYITWLVRLDRSFEGPILGMRITHQRSYIRHEEYTNHISEHLKEIEEIDIE